MNIQKPKPSGTACPNCGVDKAVGCFCASVDEISKQIKCVTCQDTGLVDCETDEGEAYAENCLSCDGTGVTGKAEAVAPKPPPGTECSAVNGSVRYVAVNCARKPTRFEKGRWWCTYHSPSQTAKRDAKDPRFLANQVRPAGILAAPPPVEVGSTGERGAGAEAPADAEAAFDDWIAGRFISGRIDVTTPSERNKAAYDAVKLGFLAGWAARGGKGANHD